jgi:hypothetical protein
MSPQPRLQLTSTLFAELTSELARRGGGTRESGAFLLTTRVPEPGDPACWQTVTAIAFYDDLDPASLTGNISFSADGYTALAALCRRDGLQVAADIHTHPGNWVRQSRTDATHPMVALPGHLALIAPNFARHPTRITDLGAHSYLGNGQWSSRYGNDVTSIVRLTEPVRARSLLTRAATRIRRVRQSLARKEHRTWRN